MVRSNVRFVRLIKGHPQLYDHRLPSFNDESVTEQVWKDVSKKIGMPVHSCKDRWKNLIKVYRKSMICRTMNRYFWRKRCLSTEMRFLIPFLRLKIVPHIGLRDLLSVRTLQRPTRRLDPACLLPEDEDSDGGFNAWMLYPRVMERMAKPEHNGKDDKETNAERFWESIHHPKNHFFKTLKPEMKNMCKDEEIKFKQEVFDYLSDILDIEGDYDDGDASS